MNRALLHHLQRLRCYPSVTILHSPSPHTDDTDVLDQLVDDADRRLAGDVDDAVRDDVVRHLRRLVDEVRDQPPAAAVALCASPDHHSLVRLGTKVRTRVVIDDTFATRDLVADLNRTAAFRLFTISDRKVRSFVGDRARLVEVLDTEWPLLRAPEQTASSWTRSVAAALRPAGDDPTATVIAGVERTVREISKGLTFSPIAIIHGNHDRSGWVDLHTMAWPLVVDWLRSDRRRALDQLDRARSSRQFAGGVHEVWELARDGRVELVVVEEGHVYPARESGGRLEPAIDVEAPDVIDDAVDELIEMVIGQGGSAVIVDDGDLADHDRIAAVLRY